MNLHIRDASTDDAKSIADFNSRMALETEGRKLDPELIGPGVAAILADSNKGRYWVAEAEGNVVGQIMVSYEWSDWRNGTFWWIGSVYVHENYRRKRVFSTLYRHVESLARQDQEVCGLRLYVEQDNKRAQETYLKLGMVKPGYLVMEVDFRNDPK
jgi:ribosomal protein S18 acetylase RimI-like enzyme